LIRKGGGFFGFFEVKKEEEEKKKKRKGKMKQIKGKMVFFLILMVFFLSFNFFSRTHSSLGRHFFLFPSQELVKGFEEDEKGKGEKKTRERGKARGGGERKIKRKEE
jgi:hypothetical protein